MKSSRFALLLGLLSALAMQGCSSIPLLTMLKMRSFNEQNFAALNGNDLRVKVRLPTPAQLVVEKTELQATLVTPQGSHSSELSLVTENLNTVEESKGLLFKERVRYSEYVLRLSDDSLLQFKKLQALAPQRDQNLESEFGIRVNFSDLPANTRELEFSVDLLLSPAEGYFTLLDNASLSLQPEQTLR